MVPTKRKPIGTSTAPSSEDSDSDSDSNSSDPEAIRLSQQQKQPLNGQRDTHPETETETETVQISFDFCDFRDSDVGMTRALLAQGAYASVPQVNDMLHALETCIVSQKAVGTTIRVDDTVNDGEIYSFLTVLPYQHMLELEGQQEQSKAKVMQDLHGYFLKHCPEELREKFVKICGEKSTGLLVNERIVNMPRELAQPLHSAVLEDMKWAKENAGAAKEMFKFARLLVLCPIVDFALKGHKKGKEGEGKRRKKREQIVFQKFDEEALAAAADLQFSCSLEPRQKAAGEGQSKGAVPQRHQPKEALLLSLSMEAYEQAVGNISTFM